MYLYIIFFILATFSLLEILRIQFRGLSDFYKFSFFFFVIFFFLLSSLRWENGTDWDSYYLYYKGFVEVSCLGEMEPGFTLITSLNSVLFNDYTIQLACVAFWSIIPVAWRYNKLSKYPLFTLFIWYGTVFAHIFPVRQNIAVALFVFSFKYIEERKLCPFLLIILIAATFHITVLVTIPVYFIWNKKVSVSFFVWVGVTLSVLSVVSQNLISSLLLLVGGELVRAKLEFYLENADATFGSAYTPMQVLVRGIINRMFVFFPLLCLLNRERIKDDRLNAFFNLYFYSFCLFLLVTPLSIALGRLCMYTDMIQALLIPCIFSIKMNRISRLLLFLIIILYFLIRFKGIVFNYEDLYIPYKCVLFQ